MKEKAAVVLQMRTPITLPVEAESLSPDQFLNRSQAEIAALPLLKGRRKVIVGDLFDVEGEASDQVVIRGDLRHVKRVGQGMTRGRITIEGNVGMHLGAYMSGGEIVVRGSADAWAGAHMRGGLLRVCGDAGPMLGAAYSGEPLGMRGGVIVVEGDAGPRTGERMRRGLIAVQGRVGAFAGARMVAGSIFAFGPLGPRPGAGMKRGTIVALGGLVDGLLPVFRFATSYYPPYMPIYLKYLDDLGLTDALEYSGAVLHRYTGDITSLGKGEILIYGEH